MEPKTAILPIAIRVPLTVEGKLPEAPASNVPQLSSSEITLEGNTENGVVHHLGYIHLLPSGNDWDDMVDGGQRRAAALRELGLLGVSCCFLEGCRIDTDLTQELPERALLPQIP